MQRLSETIRRSLEVTSGCTEPAAIAFCASFVGKYLDESPQAITLAIDQRTYKNAFAAGIPGGGDRRGAEWALLLGFVRESPEERLSIFAGLDEEALNRADQLHALDLISVELVDTEGLLIHITASGKDKVVQARIRGGHTRVDLLQIGDEMLPVAEEGGVSQEETEPFGDELFDASSWPAVIDELYSDEELRATVRQGIAYNMAAALHGKKYVDAVGSGLENLVMGAIYARMSGDPIPVMSCAGSGNKGITCLVPVVSWARERTMGEEKEIRASLMSILLTNLITSRFGEVSSVCGAQYAAGAGVIGGILYLKGHLDLFDGAYNNFVSAIGGGFCDGAKGSCSMRGNVAVSAAFNAINHAEAGFTVSGRDGFLGNTFRETLDHLARYNPLVARFELETIKILQDK
ncbi:MAG: L-serine ammonia-lyase, iron-sulfur-dependent, subunit alpha [Thermodesulfobacteriota bacterium]